MKNSLPYLPSLFLSALFFMACQKQYTFKDGLTNISAANGGTAKYLFIDSLKNCTTTLIKGNCTQGVTLDFLNTIQITVQVDSIGSYIIATSNNNGISFSGSGLFTKIGLQTILLTGAGKPLASGVFSFTAGKNSCEFTITCMSAPLAGNGCTACNYFPTCAGIKYLYMDSIITPNFLDTGSVVTVNPRQSNYLTATDTLINALLFKKIKVSDGNAISYSYINCFNGQTRVIAYFAQSATSGNTISTIDIIQLKANSIVGDSWTDTTVLNGMNNFYRTSTIMQKGISRTLAGVTYNNVIKIKVVQTIGSAPAGITEYYFASGIGLIDEIAYNINPVSNNTYVGYHSILKSYFIP